MKINLSKVLLASAAVAALMPLQQSWAALVPFQSYNGKVAMSTDGWGGLDNSGTISASVTAGSTVLAAYLYTATQGSPANSTPTVLLDGTAVAFGPEVTNTSFPHTGSHRADVTTIVKSTIEAGPGGIYNFSIQETGLGAQVDGNALVIVYENPALPEASVGILDGFAAITGDTTSINFAAPLNPADPGFFAEMILGIGFSCCNQASRVTVNGTVITNNAGNNDDGEDVANGSLITVGSFNDPFSPLLPSYADDHERYDLTSYITQGDTSITVDTINPSNNDNIFLAGFYVSGEAGFNAPPPTQQVSEPAQMSLLGFGLLITGMWLRRRKQR